jgi:hypothetical protein
MNHLIRIAIGAAIAGALVTVVMKRRAGRSMEDRRDEAADLVEREAPRGGANTGYSIGELVADTPAGRVLNS